MDYEIVLEKYRGPLHKLLELVEEKKLEITQISLSEVTGDFLSYLERLEKEIGHHVLIADFLVVASKLVLIKSKTLIPTLDLSEEEEEDIKNLEFRLKIYQELKQAQAHIKHSWSEYPQMAHRDFLMSLGVVFYPPSELTLGDLRKSIAKVAGEIEKILKSVTVVKSEMINLKEKIMEILSRITKRPIQFNSLKHGKERSEVVVLFLAILHLVKDQLVFVDQRNHFQEMTIAKKDKNT